MAVCAQLLRTDFQVEGVSQPTISRWESGITRQPHCITELLAYCDTYGPDREAVESAVASLGAEPAPEDDRHGSASEMGEFLELVARAADEPLLGPRQAELVRGMSRRLALGPPLSPTDRATYLDQLRILGIRIA